MQNDRDLLLSAIAASPADSLPRLIYADWLDEHGEEPLAAFVRRTASHDFHPVLLRAYYASGPYWSGTATGGPLDGMHLDHHGPRFPAEGGEYRYELVKAAWRWAGPVE